MFGADLKLKNVLRNKATFFVLKKEFSIILMLEIGHFVASLFSSNTIHCYTISLK